jgi:hypothetical protein
LTVAYNFALLAVMFEAVRLVTVGAEGGTMGANATPFKVAVEATV